MGSLPFLLLLAMGKTSRSGTYGRVLVCMNSEQMDTTILPCALLHGTRGAIPCIPSGHLLMGYYDSSVCSFAWDSGCNSLYSLRSFVDDGDGYSDDSDEDEGSSYSRIYRYSFKDKPRYAMLPTDDPKVDEEGYYEEEYDTEVPMDDSDEEYVD
ncbi:hypothetical protein RSAG8_02968, partial [Rhizoctonia solani AG-8 WAC10335]